MSDNLPGNDRNSNPAPPPPASSDAAHAPVAPSAPAYDPAATNHGAPAYNAGPVKPKGLALTALILGVLSLIFCWVPVAGAVGGLIALILGIIALRKGQSKGLSITGIITGAIALVIGAIVTIGFFLALSLGLSAVEECSNGAEMVEVAGQMVSCAGVN